MCGVSPATIFKTSQNMQHLTKKSVGTELGCCVVTLLLGIYQDYISDYIITNKNDEDISHGRNDAHFTQDKQFISIRYCKVLMLTSVGVTDQCQCQNVLKASFIPASVQCAAGSGQCPVMGYREVLW